MHCTHAHTRMHTRREHWKQQTRAAQVWMWDQHTQPAAPAPPRGGPAGTARGREAARMARLRLGQCPRGPACRDGGGRAGSRCLPGARSSLTGDGTGRMAAVTAARRWGCAHTAETSAQKRVERETGHAKIQNVCASRDKMFKT